MKVVRITRSFTQEPRGLSDGYAALDHISGTWNGVRINEIEYFLFPNILRIHVIFTGFKYYVSV